MYDQIREDLFFLMLYAGVAVQCMNACCYLLFHRRNAFDAGRTHGDRPRKFGAELTGPVPMSSVTMSSPPRLRRWASAFLGAIALSHLWFMPVIFLSSPEDAMLGYFVGVLLDCLTIVPLSVVVMLAMLQDRRRPLWPVAVMAAPLSAIMLYSIVSRSDALFPYLSVYFMLFGLGAIIYMVRELRVYGRWLRDNYADLEHKELWQSFTVLGVIMLVFGIYVFGVKGMTYHYIVQLNDLLLAGFLLWRVETLSDLSVEEEPECETALPSGSEVTSPDNLITSRPYNLKTSRPQDLTTSKPQDPSTLIGPLLQQHCVGGRLYLHHDLTLQHLAKAIGTNRLYLSQYFSAQGTNYNAYINSLRIAHFIELYREAVAGQRAFTAQQLAQESGFRSYSTFSDAFKRRTGQSVTAWMRSEK